MVFLVPLSSPILMPPCKPIKQASLPDLPAFLDRGNLGNQVQKIDPGSAAAEKALKQQVFLKFLVQY